MVDDWQVRELNSQVETLKDQIVDLRSRLELLATCYNRHFHDIEDPDSSNLPSPKCYIDGTPEVRE
jgi:hypothetical protein